MKTPILIDEGPVLAATGLVHRVQQPDQPGPYKTIVMVHGRMGNEDVMWIFSRTLPPNWLVISVRAILPEGDGFSWHPPFDRWPMLSEFDTAVDTLHQFIRQLPDQYHADENQIYLMGFSQGAALSYATAMAYPGLVSGIAGLVGFMPTHAMPTINEQPLLDLPVFVAIGETDDTIPLDIAVSSGEQLEAAGANVTINRYDTGHRLNGAGMRDLKAWWNDQATTM